MIELDQLQALDAIDRSGSFAGAGRELHKTTSAISYTIKTLEEALGVAVFDRSGHRAELTAAGRIVLDEGRRLLDRARGLERLAAQLRADWEPELEVVVDGILPLAPIMRALRALTERDLPTRVGLRVEYLTGVHHVFREDAADLMIALDYRPEADVHAQPLPPVPMRLVCRPDHPVRAVCPVDRSQLARHVELRVEDSAPDQRQHSARLGLGSPHVFRLSDFQSKRVALLEGVGFGWMPLHLIGDALAAGELVPLGFREGDEYTFSPQLVYRRSAPPRRAGQLLMELLVRELGRGAEAMAAAP